MAGFNLPPGCSVSDILGNRPEDQAAEAFFEALDDKAKELNVAAVDEGLGDWLWEQMGKAYGQGYQMGAHDFVMGAGNDRDVLAEELMNKHGVSNPWPKIYMRVVDAGTDNECWVVCNKVDKGAVLFEPAVPQERTS